MSKNIVICCDGTGNSFERADTDSNVVKLYSSLTVNADQIAYYHPGVGTMGAPNARGALAKTWSRIKGLAFGAGLLDIVGDAYRYLMDTYVDGDLLFLFGFSRGAYTARALAGVLHMFGLLCAGNHAAIPYILHMYSQRTRREHRRKKTFDVDETFKWEFSHRREMRIHFCGLWDTVSSYGWAYSPVKLPFEGSNPIIEIGRHAIAIHECRCYYQDNLWGESQPGQDMRQVWFSGVHSDVGGSYLESESGLSKISLEWMLVEACKAGLLIDVPKAQSVLGRVCPYPIVDGFPRYVQPNKDACCHRSLQGLWWILECLPHVDPHSDVRRLYLPFGRRRSIPHGALIHESVIHSQWKPSLLPLHEIEPWVRLDEREMSSLRCPSAGDRKQKLNTESRMKDLSDSNNGLALPWALDIPAEPV